MPNRGAFVFALGIQSFIVCVTVKENEAGPTCSIRDY